MKAPGRRYWTGYPITEFGDVPNQQAPIRRVRLVKRCRDPWCVCECDGVTFDTKVFYLHQRRRAVKR